MNSFDKLIDQVDSFIRKYYQNQIIKGLLLFSALLVASFLITAGLEYFNEFKSLGRAILFYVFIVSNALILGYFIFFPLLKLLSFGPRLTRFQAADVIGKFFPEIDDRLKNTFQLQQEIDQQNGNIELLKASIQQRTENLLKIPFVSAIKFSENKKFLPYVIPVFLLFFTLLIFTPDFITESTNRIVNYNEEFVPFTFELQSTNLTVEEGQDAEVVIALKGKKIPEQVYLVCENGTFLMERVTKNTFRYWIRKAKKSSVFYFKSGEYTSSDYFLNVTGKSLIGKIEAQLEYPSYLAKRNEIIQNVGDLVVPEGTKITWNVILKNTNKCVVNWQNKSVIESKNGFTKSSTVTQDTKLGLLYTNKFTNKKDSSSHNISVIKDVFPTIAIQEIADSISEGVRYFSGEADDDYGLTSLYFNYSVISENGNRRSTKLLVKPVSGTKVSFDFAVDFRREQVKINDRIEYYFSVSDNDGVNGKKTTKSTMSTYKLPSLEELNEKRSEQQEKSKEDLETLLKKTKDFQKNVEKLKKEAMNSKSSDWNKLNQVNQLQEEQKNLIESLDQLKNEMEQSVSEKNQLSELDKELLEKQEMLEKLLEEVMDDELKKLLEDLEKLLEQNNKEDLKEKMEQINQSADDMKKQLDRSLEMLKKMQVNEKIDDIEKELKNLAEEQKELKEDIEKKNTTKESAEKKQDEINKKFSELKEDLNELEQLNKELSRPMELGDLNEIKEKISNDLKEAKDKLGEGKDKKAGEKQKSAADEMEQLAMSLDQKQQQANKKQQTEDMDAIRALLESLMTLSFDQEKNMFDFTRVSTKDPSYTKYGRRQRRIIDDTKIVRDSLMSLAKRQAPIATFIDKELNTISLNHTQVIDNIDNHNKGAINRNQQAVMTAYNNLALLLNEALQSMQSQMQSQMEGSGQCSNPGGGRPKPGPSSPGDMKEMIKQQLEQMQKGMNPGGSKPGDQPGNKPSEGGQNMLGLGNKQIAKMAAEQTAIRQKLEQLRNELNKEGQGQGNKLNPLINELEKQEKDLINKKLGNELINRQKQILTRLLESEKAIMERGFEEKRESKSGKDYPVSNQIRFEEYNKLKLKQVEIIKSVDPFYNRYYKDKASEYFNRN
jgi:hypothetical protein